MIGNDVFQNRTSRALAAESYLPQLDGLRAISVLIVITVHMHDQIWDWLAGNHGVTIFFVLSGFLITTLSLREEERKGRLNLAAFYVRRCFRIFPAYYAVLGLYFVLIVGLGVRSDKSAAFFKVLPYYLTYLQEIPLILWGQNGALQRPFFQSWSLGIEEKFYLLWPILAFVLLARRTRLRIWFTAGLTIAFAATRSSHGVGLILFQYYPIFVGCLAAIAVHDKRATQRIATLSRPWAATLVLAVFATTHLLVLRFPTLDYLYPFAAAALILSVVAGDNWIRRLLSTKPLVFVGTLSYGIYLVHVLCLNIAERVFRPGTGRIEISILAFISSCLISIAAAYVLAQTVERPFRRFGRTLSQRLQNTRPIPGKQSTIAAAAQP